MKNKISDQAARLKKIRLYLAMTRKQFGEIIGISQFTIRSWENGVKNFTAAGVERVVFSLNKKINFLCPFDWLMYGTGSSPISIHEEKNLRDMNDGIEFDSLHEKLLKEIITFKSLNKSASVIIVSDNTFSPIAEIGDYIGFLPVDLSSLENYLGKIVYIALRNDSKVFGILNKYRNNYLRISHLTQGISTVSKNNINKIFQFIWLRKVS